MKEKRAKSIFDFVKGIYIIDSAHESMLQLTGTELMGTTPKDVQVKQKKRNI